MSPRTLTLTPTGTPIPRFSSHDFVFFVVPMDRGPPSLAASLAGASRPRAFLKPPPFGKGGGSSPVARWKPATSFFPQPQTPHCPVSTPKGLQRSTVPSEPVAFPAPDAGPPLPSASSSPKALPATTPKWPSGDPPRCRTSASHFHALVCGGFGRLGGEWALGGGGGSAQPPVGNPGDHFFLLPHLSTAVFIYL